jgi:outer membrane protein assembly factor BamB
MIDSGQPHQDADTRDVLESQHETTPWLMVGSWAGELAVVEARTGHVCWVRRTGCELGTLVMDGEAAYLAMGSAFAAMKRLQAARDDFEKGQRLREQADIPAQLEARRASDGALLWTYTHPKIKGRLHVAAESGLVIAANPRHFEADVPPIQAFDGMSGNLLWQLEGSIAQWSTDRLVAVHGGRVYACLGEHLDETVTALDLRTGRPLWQRRYYDHWVFSPNGALIGEQRPDYDRPGTMALITAHNGSELTSFPTEGVIHQLADDGIAYMDMNYYENATWIAALDMRTGVELWRAPDVAHDYLALDGTTLSYSRILPGKGNIEVGLLDAATGERLWRWRSPGSLGELLRLWGARRMPAMLWDSTEKSVATIREIVWRPWFRLRRPPPRIRMSQRRQTPGMRLRSTQQSIAQNVGWPLWHEISQGHWRHPWQVHGSMNANWLAAQWGIVFLGTWLGLFALDAATGQLLWHALPTIDLSYVEPALAP